MNSITLRDQLISEIQGIPEMHLAELLNLLHFFRIGLETTQKYSTDITLTFAGAWQDMDDKLFNELQEEIFSRRKQAFYNRRTMNADIS